MIDGIDDGTANASSLEVLHLRDCFNSVGTQFPVWSEERWKVLAVFFGIVGGIISK
jgi:hypothetical protein